VFPTERPRRLRRTPALRRLVAETTLAPDDFVAPLFVAEGLSEAREITSLPGQFQHTVESLRKEVEELVRVGVGGVIVFGVPSKKDDLGSGAWDPRRYRPGRPARHCVTSSVTTFVLMADLCLDEYTSHGHCGVRVAPTARSTTTRRIDLYARVAVAQARGRCGGRRAERHDGRSGGRDPRGRSTSAGFDDTIILAYAAKYASGLYGPFRDAVGVEIIEGGDRKGYQQDYRNRREALREARADVAQGADIVMVKPAMSYLDVVSDLHVALEVPAVRLSREWRVRDGEGGGRSTVGSTNRPSRSNS
jgi:porphobilinogen synthase